jgi:non-homologous end joining protein Ku
MSRQFKDKNEKELMKLIAEKRKALQAFRFGSSGSKTRNVKEGMGFEKKLPRC